MKFCSGSGTGITAEPGPRSTFRNHKRLASLAILFALLALSLGCGLIGGGEADAEESFSTHETIESDNVREAATARETEATETEAETEATAETEAESAATEEPVTAEPEPEAEPEPTVNPALVQSVELARDLAWVHVSRCVTLKSNELAATRIKADWFIASSTDATRAYGYWKVDALTGEVTPHDTLSRLWQAAIDSQCSAESLEAVAGPAEPQSPVIVDAVQATTTVWSFLSRCGGKPGPPENTGPPMTTALPTARF